MKGWSVGLRCQMRAEKCQLKQTNAGRPLVSFFDEVKWVEIRSLWIEKYKLSKRKQKGQATISPRVILKPMTLLLLWFFIFIFFIPLESQLRQAVKAVIQKGLPSIWS